MKKYLEDGVGYWFQLRVKVSMSLLGGQRERQNPGHCDVKGIGLRGQERSIYWSRIHFVGRLARWVCLSKQRQHGRLPLWGRKQYKQEEVTRIFLNKSFGWTNNFWKLLTSLIWNVLKILPFSYRKSNVTAKKWRQRIAWDWERKLVLILLNIKQFTLPFCFSHINWV